MILLIATHELRRSLVSLAAWATVAVVSFLGAVFFLVLLRNWENTSELELRGGLSETVAADFLQLGALMLLLLTPLLTMRLFSEERRRNTLKLLLSSPLSITHLVLGKFLGVVVLYCALVLLLVLMPLIMLPTAVLDYGQIAAATLGLLLMATSLAAVGLFVSSMCASQTSAALGTFGVLCLLWIAGLSEGGGLFAWLSLLNHYNHFRDGMFRSADLIYYLLLSGAGIGLAIWRLDIERLHGRGAAPLRANSIAALCLLLLLLALLAWASMHHGVRYDWTRYGRHSLSDASQETLALLPDALQVSCYARDEPLLRSKIADFVARYQQHKENLELRFVNPDTAPNEVRRLNIRVDGELVLQYGDQVEHVRRFGEQHFSNALLRLARGEKHWLAFVEGHGERDPFGKEGQNLSQWARHLEEQGFRVQPLDLDAIGAVPDNVSVLVLGNPQSDYLEEELDLLRGYIQRGGNLLWLVDPGALRGLRSLGEMLGVEFEPGTVVDPRQKHPLLVPIHPQQYGQHPITQDLLASAILPGSTSILLRGRSTTWQSEPLLRTGLHAWNETGALSEARYEEGADRAGPLNLGISLRRRAAPLAQANTSSHRQTNLIPNAASPAQANAKQMSPEVSPGISPSQIADQRNAASLSVPGRGKGDAAGAGRAEQRVVVIGDGDFLSNAYLSTGGNLELGMRVINWLSAEDQLLHISTRTQPDIGVHPPRRALQWGGILFLLGLPMASLLSGLLVRLRRKRRR